jgi:hypothetical protein
MTNFEFWKQGISPEYFMSLADVMAFECDECPAEKRCTEVTRVNKSLDCKEKFLIWCEDTYKEEK